jgi:hypothetical protein
MRNPIDFMPPYTLPTEEDIVINWWVDDEIVQRIHDVPESFPQDQDWYVILELPFGRLGYDEEEGYKIKTTFAKLKQAANWLRSFHIQHAVPFVDDEARAVINAKSCVSSTKLDEVNKPKFEAAGFIADQYHTWSLL